MQTQAADNAGRRFFTRTDWAAFWTATLVTFGVYFATLAPTVTLEDSGELATGGAHWGVPHPPGYPIWTILANLFTRLLFFATYRGQPNPAWAIGLMSAFFGALAAGVGAMLVCHSGAAAVDIFRREQHTVSRATEKLICWTGGVSSSLIFAFTGINWSQSVIVEVYSLNAFFLALILLMAYVWTYTHKDEDDVPAGRADRYVAAVGAVLMALLLFDASFLGYSDITIVLRVLVGLTVCILLVMGWRKNPNARLLTATAFVFGLGLTNYQALLLLFPALLVVILINDLKLTRDMFIVAVPYGIVIFLAAVDLSDAPAWLRSLQLPPVDHPTHLVCDVYFCLNAVGLALAYFFLPRGRTVLMAIAALELGLAVYGYMPLASDGNPPINWGYPRTWDGFKHAITRGQYEKIVATPIYSMDFVRQVGAYLSDLRANFDLPIVVLGFLPFAVWRIRLGRERLRALQIAVALGFAAGVLIATEELIVPSGIPAMSFAYKVLILGVMALLVVGAAVVVVSQIGDLIDVLRGKRPATVSERIMAGVGVAGVALVVILHVIASLGVFVDLTAPLREGAKGLKDDQIRMLVMAGAEAIVLLIVAPLAFTAAIVWLMRAKSRLELCIDPTFRKWMLSVMAGFLVMSIMFVDLASPKGDIQDYFIQRVKFISSHAVFSLWIGTGIILGLTLVYTLFKERAWVKWGGVAFALLLPLVPVRENYFNKERIRIVGGAEMNGHDFGWQFGNYELRGAEAIREERSPDEEPLPDPSYPRPMGPGAIFFGGTDPGRFVPTYMIYCADVRPDAFLITQNALADNTYMNVMRDLYGTQIWIPSMTDSAEAFHRYVDEVDSGKRQKNADLTIENGRVQVSGALGVMEINGILAQMIFEHNNYGHAFYVEESYVLPWMYPYMEPHGLIMKIDRDDNTNHLTAATVAADQDFWDWYTRRLMSNPKFLRDVCARKSFSKLRSAIAGLYANRGRSRDAEIAFHEARILYPLSPEANFRLVHEVYMPARRIDAARDVMAQFGVLDPGNTKVPEFVAYLDGLERMQHRMAELEGQVTQGRLDMNNALELAGLYQQAGQTQRLLGLAGGIMSNTGLPAVVYFRLGQILSHADQPAEAGHALDLCLTRRTADMPPEVLLDIVSMYGSLGNRSKMMTALAAYLEQRPKDWRGWLDMAALQLGGDDVPGATKSLDRAVQGGGVEAMDAIQKDSRFAPLQRRMAPSAARPLMLPGMPDAAEPPDLP